MNQSDDLVFLDSRDLRDLVLASRPLSTKEFAMLLLHAGKRIVLTFTNIPEMFGRYEMDEARIERECAKLESIPHVCVKGQAIARAEFTAAVESFLAGTPEVSNVLPVVPSWLDSWEPIGGDSFSDPVEQMIRRLKTFPLRAQVSIGMRIEPGILRFSDASQLAAAIARDREVLGTKRGDATVFENGVMSWLNRFGLLQRFESDDQLHSFAKWARDNPEFVCPGWRVGFDAYEALRADQAYEVETNDIADWAHVFLVPYTFASTLDKQWRNYCEIARRQRIKDGLPAPYFDRVVKNTAEIVRLIGTRNT